MNKGLISQRSFCILSGLGGVAGVVLLIVSFAINNGPPPDPSSAELVKFGQQHFATILWGAWLQAVGPVLIVLFAFALVHLAGATQRLAGWMTFFGATIFIQQRWANRRYSKLRQNTREARYGQLTMWDCGRRSGLFATLRPLPNHDQPGVICLGQKQVFRGLDAGSGRDQATSPPIR